MEPNASANSKSEYRSMQVSCIYDIIPNRCEKKCILIPAYIYSECVMMIFWKFKWCRMRHIILMPFVIVIYANMHAHRTYTIYSTYSRIYATEKSIISLMSWVMRTIFAFAISNLNHNYFDAFEMWNVWQLRDPFSNFPFIHQFRWLSLQPY